MKRNKRFLYTPRQLSFLREFYRFMKVEDLTDAFNLVYGMRKSGRAIRSALKNHRITCGRKHSERFIRRLRIYTEEQVQFLRENYAGRVVAELTELFNSRFGTSMTVQQIKSAVHNRHITCGRTGQFEKGHLPWNTGTKGQGLTGRNKTSFRVGNVPANRKPLGSERLGKDGYVEIKVAERNPYTGFPTRYKQKHVHIWEQLHGPAPKGFAVVFADSDNRNFDPSNLVLVSRAELLELNRQKYREAPADLKPSVLALAKLQVKTRAKEKEIGR